MSPESTPSNTETLHRFFACLRDGDYRGMQACLHPDVEFSDIGFELRGREVAAMWHMILSKGLRVAYRDLVADDRDGGTARWECDYEFRKDADSTPRPVHNEVESRFRFENGLIREQRDTCDFWTWFEQATGLIGKGAHLFTFLEEKVEQLLQRDVPVDVERRVREKVKATARRKIDDFIGEHPEYAS